MLRLTTSEIWGLPATHEEPVEADTICRNSAARLSFKNALLKHLMRTMARAKCHPSPIVAQGTAGC